MPTKAVPAPPRASRSDGLQTRQQILDVAGTLFAENGFSRTTSKEICAAAGCNQAAVNYHFKGREGLYGEVLVEAHRQIVSLDELERIAAERGTPRERLLHVLRSVLARAPDARRHWGMRVLIREMLSPSQQVPSFIREAVLPKARIVIGLVAAVLELPPGHPGVQRALAFVMLPSVMLLVLPKEARRQVLPAVDADPAATTDEMLAYIGAGLEALRRLHATAPAAPATRPRPPAKARARRSP
jgi:AcrR family transcriptional regulator